MTPPKREDCIHNGVCKYNDDLCAADCGYFEEIQKEEIKTDDFRRKVDTQIIPRWQLMVTICTNAIICEEKEFRNIIKNLKPCLDEDMKSRLKKIAELLEEAAA
jgi:hypothetical protein